MMKHLFLFAFAISSLTVTGCSTSDEIMQPQFNHGICELGGECQPPPEDPNPSAPGIWIDGYSLAECLGSVQPFSDTDGDGMDQGCEYTLATAFAPEFIVDFDCIWDDEREVLGGEYMYAVEPVDGTIRIVYMPAYYWDCGDASTNPAQKLFAGEGSHPGDSEMIIVEVSYVSSTQHWLSGDIFLSAHCGEDYYMDVKCDWYSNSEFAFVDSRPKGAPVIWVASSKHANYKSRSSCEDNNLFTEICYEAARYRFPFVGNPFTQNVGNGAYPLRNCIEAFWDSSGLPVATRPESGRTECFFSVREFKGWQSESGSSTSYSYNLGYYAGI